MTNEGIRILSRSIVKFDILLRRRCHLEIHLSEHCNLNCIGCTHYSPLAEHSFCDCDQLDVNLQKLSKIQDQFETILLLGGEPLLNPDAVRVFAIARKHFKTVNLKVVTNGVPLLRKLPEDFWQACRDYKVSICFTEYPINVDYAELKNLCWRNGVRTEIFHQPAWFKLFRLNIKKTGNKLHYYICSGSLCLNLLGNKLFSCPQSAYVEYLNKAFGYDFKHSKGDYITVDNISRFRFRRFLLTPRPFCSYCVFPRPQVDWRCSERKASEWIEE